MVTTLKKSINKIKSTNI